MKSPPLIEYYEEIRNKAGIALDEKENMKRFNDVRRVFKHKGWIVSKSDIDTSKTNVLNIFQNTLLVFGIDFESLSLIEFVECSVVKELLFEAQEDMKNLESTEAANKISAAFDYLINDYLNEIFGYDNNPTKHMKEEEKANYFGLNYSDYLRFRKLVSTPFRVNGIPLEKPSNTRQYIKKENQFCLNFTVGAAIKIQKYLHSDVYD